MIAALIWLVIYIIIIGCVFWLLMWMIDYVGLPEPFHKIARVLIAVVAVLIVLLLLLRLLNISGGDLPKLSSVTGESTWIDSNEHVQNWHRSKPISFATMIVLP